jgi:glycosyltransferase involved in cell wall biosynthesis
LFIHGVHGYFPKEGDVKEYVEYLAELMSNERLAWKMGYKAWKVAKRYTWEMHAERLVKVIKGDP